MPELDSQSTSTAMLAPYRVLDLTDHRGEIGPMLLGDLGADVIRVEPPGGSSARSTQPLLPDTTGVSEDLHSLSFAAFNRNKRSIVLDPNSAEDRQCLADLIARSDFIFESSPTPTLAQYQFDFAAARELNPQVVYVRISPFGDTGPYAHFVGDDLVVAAMGGPVSLQGDADRAPLRMSVPQVWRHAGVEAAAGALVAHRKMLASQEAQFVDLSAQCVMTWTMLNAMDAHAIQGFDFERAGGMLNNGVLTIDIVHPTKDGHIVGLQLSKVIVACLDRMIEEGVAQPSLREMDWEAYDAHIMQPGVGPMSLEEGTALCRRFFARHTNKELFEFGLAQGITLAPVNTLGELLSLEHLAYRKYWQTMSLPNGQKVQAPGLWVKPEGASLEIRYPAPGLDEHGATIREELNREPTRDSGTDAAPASALPFAGVKVTDFAWVGVGPISSKYLADHGAEVIRVESESRPDVLRAGGPFKGGQPGLNQSQFFGDFNTSKRSLGLDMKSPQAIDLVKQLIQGSDVLIESFAPGAIGRMGLGFDEVRKLNPGIIMVSTCLMGQTGPAAEMAGFGYHAAAMAGFYEVMGWPDRPPMGPWVAYTDTIAPRFVSTLLAAALDQKRRTGKGCYLDIAQLEAALHFLGPELLLAQAGGNTASRLGNRSPYAAPQGCYPCQPEPGATGDAWCAIAVDTDEQWHALAAAMGKGNAANDWLQKPDFKTHAQRLAQHDTLDAAITLWSQQFTAPALMQKLQGVGVPAGVVQRSSDLLRDPQYEHRGFYQYFDHPEMGRIPYAGHQYKISNYANGPRGPAPLLGQHSFEVLSEVLQLDAAKIAEAFASGAVG